jgi:1,4-dihydroxy-2-naphthoate octaprenyltransferase
MKHFIGYAIASFFANIPCLACLVIAGFLSFNQKPWWGVFFIGGLLLKASIAYDGGESEKDSIPEF